MPKSLPTCLLTGYVRINDQWRLTFKWGENGPYDVLIEDPH
jgi:proteic killer suppression protein